MITSNKRLLRVARTKVLRRSFFVLLARRKSASVGSVPPCSAYFPNPFVETITINCYTVDKRGWVGYNLSEQVHKKERLEMKLLKTGKIPKKLIAALALLALIFCACTIYVLDYYHADGEAISSFLTTSEVRCTEIRGGLAFGDGSEECGFIFYPGGKVEYTAYAPLAMALAARGIFTVILSMPMNLAVLDVNAADGVPELFPDVSRWYIGGHSLGGSMAASYAEAHSTELSGVILLGSYSTADISSLGLRVLSVYGSEDGVMNREKYEECLANLPESFSERVIAGGCHAYFGMYGEQDGDGTPGLTPTEQINIAAEHICEFCIG